MAADRILEIRPGLRGLNIRDSRLALRADELADAINFRIDPRGAIEKRLGYAAYASAAPSAITRLFSYQPSDPLGGQLLCSCEDGAVYWTSDLATWVLVCQFTVPTAPSFAQYLDNVYISNGTDQVIRWDGVAAVGIAGIPRARLLCVWQNVLFAANVAGSERTVRWSKLGLPEDFTNANNFVRFPQYPPINGLCTVTDIALETTGADGLLVFTPRSITRIYDPSDNASGVTTGGSNVIVDDHQGLAAEQTLVAVRGRLYFLSQDGVYSTDGHAPARLETRKLEPYFRGSGFDQADAASFCAAAWQGCYLLSTIPSGALTNQLMLELYVDLPADEEGQHPWMAHDVPARAMLTLPDQSVVFADASDADTARVRLLYQGSADTDGDSALVDIHCRARTGLLGFGLEGQKSVRWLRAFGYGSFTVTMLDEQGGAEPQAFQIVVSQATWNPARSWGGVWGGDGAPPDSSARRAYTRRGQLLALEIAETSQAAGPVRDQIGGGLTTQTRGGVSISDLQIDLVPLPDVL